MAPDLSDDTKVGDILDQGDGDSASGSDADDADADELLTDDDVMLVDTSVSCENCVHQGVCAVWGNFKDQVAEQIPQRTGGEPAFDPTELAIICGYYATSEEVSG